MIKDYHFNYYLKDGVLWSFYEYLIDGSVDLTCMYHLFYTYLDQNFTSYSQTLKCEWVCVRQ